MELLSKNEKNNISGGIAPMVLWVAMMGVATLVSTAVSAITSLVSLGHDNGNGYNSGQHNAYLKANMNPKYSNVSMPM